MLRKISAILCIVPLLPQFAFPQQVAVGNRLPPEKVTAALYCMHHDSDREWVKEFSGGNFFRVRYYFGGMESDVKEPDTLYLMIFSRDGRRSWLYAGDFMRIDGIWIFKWELSAQLRLKNQGWKIVDALGGESTHARLERISGLISDTEELKIPFPLIKQPDTTCKTPF